MCMYPKVRDIDCRDGIRRRMVTSCGKCFECQRKYSSEWALRLYHERQYSQYCFFLTLTYADEYLPNGLVKSDFQKFILTLKKYADFRYFGCGEYGGQTGRPHYHCLLYTDDVDVFDLYESLGHVHSRLVEGFWNKGLVDFLPKVDFSAFKYVCKYMQKSQYAFVSASNRLKPFLMMSHRPFIGLRTNDLLKWLSARQGDYNFYVEGRPYPIPNFYRQVISREMPEFKYAYNEHVHAPYGEESRLIIEHADEVNRALSRPCVKH